MLTARSMSIQVKCQLVSVLISNSAFNIQDYNIVLLASEKTKKLKKREKDGTTGWYKGPVIGQIKNRKRDRALKRHNFPNQDT